MHETDRRALFAKMDTDGSGFIDASDYRRILKGWATNRAVRDRILRMDTNLDGKVSFEEFSRYMAEAMAESTEAPTSSGFTRPDGSVHWFKVFLHFDRDGSGTMSLDELRGLLEEIDHDKGRGELVEIIRAMDTNADLEISYAEFKHYFEGAPEQRRLRRHV